MTPPPPPPSLHLWFWMLLAVVCFSGRNAVFVLGQQQPQQQRQLGRGGGVRHRRLADEMKVAVAVGALRDASDGAGAVEGLEATANLELRKCDDDELDGDGKMPACCGDCDSDGDCSGDLVCHQRGSDDDLDGIFGCEGTPESSTDYCVFPPPPTEPPTAPPTVWMPPMVIVEPPDDDDDNEEHLNATGTLGGDFLPPLRDVDRDELKAREDEKLLECEGDCDDDEDCRGNELICFERSSRSNKRVPGCSGEGTSGRDYCIHKNSMAYLDLCQGDCDSDNDCYGDLMCHKRKDDEVVPGCGGPGKDGVNYCITPDAPGPMSRAATFSLKLYFTKFSSQHYDRYCVSCDSSGENCDLSKSCSDEYRFRNYDEAAQMTMIQVDGRDDRCLEVTSTRYYGRTANGLRLEVRTCDETNECQRFGSGLGNFSGYLFELTTCNGKCITNDHWPRSGEDLFAESCDRARRHITNYWHKY